MRKRHGFVLVVGAVLALATGCSSDNGGDKIASISSAPKSGEPAAAKATGTQEDQMRAYAKCMREHGVDMPDPEMSPDGKGGRITINGDGKNGDPGKLDAASEACKTLLPNGGEMKQMDPAQLDKLRENAKCMREHGVDMPDPDPSNPGMMRIGGENADKDKLDAAMKACGMGMAGSAEPAK
jgi:hypothetical protein